MPDEKSLIDLNGLSHPATTLIEKISDAIGVWYEPHRMIKQAQAQAYVDLIKFNSARHLSQLEQRAMESFISKEAKKQDNIEKITTAAIAALDAKSKPEDIDSDWLSYFFNKCEHITEPQMQRVWGEILSRKASDKTAYSKKTIQILSTLEMADAETFTNFCSYVVHRADLHEIHIFDLEHEIYTKGGVNFGNTLHLQSLGLIQYLSSGYTYNIRDELIKSDTDENTSYLPIKYFNRDFELRFNLEINEHIIEDEILLDYGLASFTTAGYEIFTICQAQPNPKFINYWSKKLRERNRILVEVI